MRVPLSFGQAGGPVRDGTGPGKVRRPVMTGHDTPAYLCNNGSVTGGDGPRTSPE